VRSNFEEFKEKWPRRPFEGYSKWTKEDDKNLLRGVYKHGLSGRFDKIKQDPELGFANKTLADYEDPKDGNVLFLSVLSLHSFYLIRISCTHPPPHTHIHTLRNRVDSYYMFFFIVEKKKSKNDKPQEKIQNESTATNAENENTSPTTTTAPTPTSAPHESGSILPPTEEAPLSSDKMETETTKSEVKKKEDKKEEWIPWNALQKRVRYLLKRLGIFH
jgi:hypothetical protein